jgi:hypothetical protein
MNDFNSTSNVLDFAEGEKPKLSTGLNVLTILTFIGCAVGFIGLIWNYTNAEKAYKDIQAAQEKLSEAPAFVRGMMGPEMVEVTRKMLENKLPILLLGIVSTALCLYGAIEMRKLKKQGFLLYIAGEVLPIVSSLLFIGAGSFKGFGLLGVIIPVIFIILYAVQKKNLVY